MFFFNKDLPPSVVFRGNESDKEKIAQLRSKYLQRFQHINLTAYYLGKDGTKTQEKVDWNRIMKLGVQHFVLNASLLETDPDLMEMREERGYSYFDYIDSTKMPNLKERLATFNEEHLHDDEEIRFFVNGSGYFDIRDAFHKEELWIRIECKKTIC